MLLSSQQRFGITDGQAAAITPLLLQGLLMWTACFPFHLGTSYRHIQGVFAEPWMLSLQQQWNITSFVPPFLRRHTTCLKDTSLCAGSWSYVQGLACLWRSRSDAGWGLDVLRGALFLSRGQKPLCWREMTQTTGVLLLIHFSTVNYWELQQWSWLMSFLCNTQWLLKALMNMYWKVEQILLDGRKKFRRYAWVDL